MVRAGVLFTLLAGTSGAAFAAGADDTVVITASPLADKFTSSVETVNRQDILDNGGASLADALKDTPGVSGTGFAAGANRPVIRGMDATRVKLLEDGFSSSDVSDIGPDHGVPIDPLSAQRIEVVRGPATLRYGSQAIGGVVNAINNRIPTNLPSAAISGEASVAGDSVADTREGSALLDGRLGRLAFHADGFTRFADDYATPLGVQHNSFFHGGGYSFGSSYFTPRDNRVGAVFVHYDARYGIPSDTTFIDMRQDKALASATIHGDASGPVQKLDLNFGYANYIHDEKDPDGTIASTFKNQEYDARAEVLIGKTGWPSASAVGVQATNRTFSAGGEGGDYLLPALERSGALFVFTEAPLATGLKLQGAARVEAAEVSGTPASNLDTSRRYTPISGSIGALWDATDQVRFGLTFTSAARTPAITELFARGPHDGPGTFETGDPTLGLERANSLEGNVRARASRLAFDGALWRADFSNYIYGRLTGRTCDADGTCFADDTHDLKELNYSAADAIFWGAEAKASYVLAHAAGGALSVDALADMVRADFAHGGGPVPRIQPWRLGAGPSWSNDKWDAGMLFVHVGAQDRAPVGDGPTPAYDDLSAHVSWKPFAPRKGPELALIGQNLTDAVQRNAVAINRDEVLMPGRNVRLVLRQSF